MFLSGSPLGVMFIAPGITPWKTTLPGVKNGANNPGMRLFQYDTKTLEIKVRGIHACCSTFEKVHILVNTTRCLGDISS